MREIHGKEEEGRVDALQQQRPFLSKLWVPMKRGDRNAIFQHSWREQLPGGAKCLFSFIPHCNLQMFIVVSAIGDRE